MNKYLLTFVIFILASTEVFANPNVKARTGILVDFHSNEVLFELDQILKFILLQ